MIDTEFHTALPAVPGLRFRRFAGPQDYPGMVGVTMAARADAGVDELVTVETLANHFDHLSNTDPDRDIVVVELAGRIVGYSRVEWSDLNAGGRAYDQHCRVDPAVCGRGIGGALLAWGESRAREIAAGQPDSDDRWHGAGTSDADVRAANLLRGHGYSPVRTFYVLVRPTLDDIGPTAVPEGFEVRPVAREHLRAIFDADAKAFRDHWGVVHDDDASFERFAGDPHLDPSIFVVAFAGDEIAGAVLNQIDDEENARFDRRRGLLDSVFVRRPYRRRGLARALVNLSLVRLRERGMTSAYLGVDSENEHAAVHLYESCGFERARSNTYWRKPLNLTGV
ncbi:MAG TPA: GNAT family N-acetyltransferase [Candidatus Limnocylindrales bacterium]|nr:GNAT family N-acetyltransferase [Candidatus Limnocylindrales bacterium]